MFPFMIRIYGIGGYEEVGRNMTCIEVDEEAIILDMGLYMDRFVALQEKGIEMSYENLLAEDAIPDDGTITHLKKKVKGIVISHAHLDHIGAIKWLYSRYNAPVITTPYTAEIIEKNAKVKKLIRVNINSSYKISKNIGIEFINVTHSVPQAAIINVKTKYGNILYGLDYKNDSHPIVGRKTNIKKLKELDDVLLLIADSTNADEKKKTFSEVIAKEMLRDIMLGMETNKHGIFITTFSSHIARQKSILSIVKTLGRKAVFIGRSMYDYIESAEKLKIVDFSEAEKIKVPKKNSKKLEELNKRKDEYVFIVTGGMGEKNAVLTQLADDKLPLKISPQDFVIFSCNVIPTPTIRANRQILEQKLHRKKARIFKDIHVSGHAAREDLRDLIKITEPRHILPAHGSIDKTASLAALAGEMGYELGKNVHMIQNGQSISI
ncbi:MAG: MBL fold metallo-hydrolase [Thermoplasmata archaeon]|nr:MAG: MBL fold metallo-hydrolase [Thermoplasmata archaeon]